jgi:uncharacterized membrane protein
MMSSNKQGAIKSKELLRLETFSDGVFAIAITLLVLELIGVLHSGRRESLLQLLASNWKSFVVFLVGFLTILVCWINHHLVLSYVDSTDSKLFWVNGFVLLVVTVTPFPTAILAEYLERESNIAMAVFGFNYIMMSVASYSISAYIYNNLIAAEDRELFYYHKLLYQYSIPYNVVNFFICFLSVPLAIFFYLIMFFVFAFPKEFSQALLKRKQQKKKRLAKHAAKAQEKKANEIHPIENSSS